MEDWEKINAVQRMQNFIGQNLNRPITLYALSQYAGYSPFHCSRIFKELIGKAPFEYIRDLRLSQAALRLRDGQPKIVDVAFDFVFDSHEGFTRAFSKRFGISPRRYRNNPSPIYLFMPYSIRSLYQHLTKGEQKMANKPAASTVFVQVIERPARKLIIKRGIKAEDYFAYCEEVGCDVWGLLSSVKEALYEPVGLWLPEKFRATGTSRYVQGVEVPQDYAGGVPDGFEVLDLSPCQMMVFQGQPYADENFGSAISELWAAMKIYQPELYGYQWADEDAPRFQLEPQGYRGYIEARPVRPVNR